MSRSWFRTFAMAALTLSMGIASCDSLPTEPRENATVPQTIAAAPAAPVAAVVHSGDYHFVESAPETGTILDILKVINLTGGSLGVLSHTLKVPFGAVILPTIFTMQVEKNGHIEVELHALVQSLLGLLDIGGKGFLKPVTLSLSYKSAINVTDPSRLRIALLNDDGTIAEILPTTLDTKNKKVSADLPHFSRYAVVCD
jgi:hypothetical protein